MHEKKEKWIDVTRGVAIYLMVLGHCIQYATPLDYNFHGNIVFRVIYGFHMPLFMILSGYLFWYSLQKYDLLHGIISKIKGIMIPCAVWGLVTYICDIVIFNYQDRSLGGYLYYTAFSNWFLWAVFYCSLYGFISKYLFKNCLYGYFVLILINYLIPEIGNYFGAKRLLPFFILGILINRYCLIDRLRDKNAKMMIGILGLAYCFSLHFEMVELVTGTVGSLFAIMIIYELSQRIKLSFLQQMGRLSICIYLFTGILFYFFVKESLRIPDSYRYLIKAAWVFGLSVILTFFAFCVGKLFQKSKIASRLFLGR